MVEYTTKMNLGGKKTGEQNFTFMRRVNMKEINMKYPLPSEDKVASLYSKFQYDKVTINKTEELIGIFGTLCDYMVDNGRCDVFCPYAETKDKDGECEAWRTIQKIRQEG